MGQRFEKVVQEDLNIGTDTVWVTAPGSGKLLSTQIGLHSVARGQQQYQAAWTPGAIAAGLSASTTLTVPDAATGDFVMASHDKIRTSDLRISGNVSAAGTAQVVIHNPTASSVTVAAGTVSVLVFQSIGTSTDPVGSNITGTVTYDEFPYGAAPGPVWPSVAVSLDLDGVPWAGGTETTDANGVYTSIPEFRKHRPPAMHPSCDSVAKLFDQPELVDRVAHGSGVEHLCLHRCTRHGRGHMPSRSPVLA